MFTVASSDDDARPLRKRVRVKDGVIERRKDDFLPPTFYRFQEKRFDSLSDVANWLDRWSRFGSYALILSELKQDIGYKAVRRTGDLFRRAPTRFYVAEIDGAPFLDGYSNDDLIRDPRGVAEKHVRHYLSLPDDAGLVVMLSSSAGFEKDGKLGLRCHAWVELARPITPAALDLFDEKFKPLCPALDTSIRTPGQLVLIAPPIIEGAENPFPERIFHYPGKVKVANVPEVQDLVPATVMRQRGGTKMTVTMPPECAMEGQRNLTMWNYVVAAKGAGMTCDEVVMHVHDRLTELGATADTWRRHGGTSLTAVRDMYRRAKPGEQKELYAAPPYVETGGSVASAYTDLDQDVSAAVKSGGDYLFRADLGVGKTQVIVDHATTINKKVVLLTPSIERADELCGRLNDAFEARDTPWEEYDWHAEIEKRWEVWRGRTQPGMCQRSDAALAYMQAGGSVMSDMCGVGQETKCPHYDQCPFIDQYREIDRFRWILPSQTLLHPRRVASDADIVLVDEGFIDTLAGMTTFRLDKLLSKREPRLEELSQKVMATLISGDTDEMAPTDFGLTRDEVEEALNLEKSFAPVFNVTPETADEQIVKRVEESKSQYYPSLVAFWRALFAELDLDRLFVNSIHKYWVEGEDEHWKVRVAWRRTPRLIDNAGTRLFFDATPNVTAMTAHFPDLEVKDYRAPNQNLHVVQVGNRKGGKTQFLAPDSENKKDAARAAKARADLVQWVEAQPGRTLLVVPKAVRERIEDEFSQRSFAMAHYGALEGQDLWQFDETVKGEDLDTIVIAGRMAPPAWAMEAIASAHHFDGDKIDRAPVERGMSWYRDSYRVLADGVAGIELEHLDERVTAALRKVLVGSLMQALGRMRGTRRSKLGRVFIMHSMAIDVGVHEVISQEDLRARFSDVVLLSPSEVERVFGYSGAFIRRSSLAGNVRYWTRDGQTQPFRVWVSEAIDDERLGDVMQLLGAKRWERGAQR